MTRDEAAWLESMRQSREPAWHVGRDYPGAPLKCYYIDPKYLRLRKMDAPMWQTPFRKRTDLSDTWVSYIHGAPLKMRLHAALRRFWRAFKG